MSEPTVACCTCEYSKADLQRKYKLKNCGKVDGCNMWKKREEIKNS